MDGRLSVDHVPYQLIKASVYLDTASTAHSFGPLSRSTRIFNYYRRGCPAIHSDFSTQALPGSGRPITVSRLAPTHPGHPPSFLAPSSYPRPLFSSFLATLENEAPPLLPHTPYLGYRRSGLIVTSLHIALEALDPIRPFSSLSPLGGRTSTAPIALRSPSRLGFVTRIDTKLLLPHRQITCYSCTKSSVPAARCSILCTCSAPARSISHGLVDHSVLTFQRLGITYLTIYIRRLST